MYRFPSLRILVPLTFMRAFRLNYFRKITLHTLRHEGYYRDCQQNVPLDLVHCRWAKADRLQLQKMRNEIQTSATTRIRSFPSTLQKVMPQSLQDTWNKPAEIRNHIAQIGQAQHGEHHTLCQQHIVHHSHQRHDGGFRNRSIVRKRRCMMCKSEPRPRKTFQV